MVEKHVIWRMEADIEQYNYLKVFWSWEENSKHIPHIFVCRQLTQPCNLLFQDGCHHIQYATYLLQGTYPKYLSAGCWRNLATLDFWMDAFKISMQPTYFEAHTPNFCLPAADTTLQPWISGWMLPNSVCNLPPSKHIPQIFVCRQVTQPCNLGYLDGCFQNQYATYPHPSTHPKFLSAGRWCNLATLDIWMDASKISMQPTPIQAHSPNFCLPAGDATLQPRISGWMLSKSVCNLPTFKNANPYI